MTSSALPSFRKLHTFRRCLKNIGYHIKWAPDYLLIIHGNAQIWQDYQKDLADWKHIWMVIDPKAYLEAEELVARANEVEAEMQKKSLTHNWWHCDYMYSLRKRADVIIDDLSNRYDVYCKLHKELCIARKRQVETNSAK